MIHNVHVQSALATLTSAAAAVATSPFVDVLKTISISVISGLITFTISQVLSAVLKRGPKDS